MIVIIRETVVIVSGSTTQKQVPFWTASFFLANQSFLKNF